MNSYGFAQVLHEFAKIKYMLNLFLRNLLKLSDTKRKRPEVTLYTFQFKFVSTYSLLAM